MNTKASKKTSKKKPSAYPSAYRMLADVEISPAVEEILKSNEAKLYLTAIDRAAAKLRAMIERELVLARHPGHASSS